MDDFDWKAALKALACTVLVLGSFAAVFFVGAYWHGWRPLL